MKWSLSMMCTLNLFKSTDLQYLIANNDVIGLEDWYPDSWHRFKQECSWAQKGSLHVLLTDDHQNRPVLTSIYKSKHHSVVVGLISSCCSGKWACTLWRKPGPEWAVEIEPKLWLQRWWHMTVKITMYLNFSLFTASVPYSQYLEIKQRYP